MRVRSETERQRRRKRHTGTKERKLEVGTAFSGSGEWNSHLGTPKVKH